MRLLLAGLVAWTSLVAGCTDPPPTLGSRPRACQVDGDCGRGRYCSEASVCRRDCEIDAHCYGPSTTAQCNAQGKCIDTVDAAPPPDDTGTRDSGKPAPDGAPADTGMGGGA